MSKRTKNLRKMSAPPATEVEIEFRVTIKEIHTRTLTMCDKRSETFQFEFSHDFEAALEWLNSNIPWLDIEEMCDAARHRMAVDAEAAR